MKLNQICLNCNSKPVNPGHQFCGRTCGISYNNNNNIQNQNVNNQNGSIPFNQNGFNQNSFNSPNSSQMIPNNSQICLNCNSKPVNPGHQFCSRNCGIAYNNQNQNGFNNQNGSNLNTQINPQICLNCKIRPVNQGHQFCSRNCGITYNNNNIQNQNVFNLQNTINSNQNASQICLNCKIKSANQGHQFCSRSCGIAYNQNGSNLKICQNTTNNIPNSQLCLNCKTKQVSPGYQFCNRNCGKKYHINFIQNQQILPSQNTNSNEFNFLLEMTQHKYFPKESVLDFIKACAKQKMKVKKISEVKKSFFF